MYLNQDISFIRDSQNAANLVISIQQFYSSLRKFCNKIILLSIGFPVLIIVNLALWMINRKLRKNARKPIVINLDNYQEMKILQRDFNQLSSRLDTVKNLQANTKNPVIIFFVKQVRQLSINIDKHRIDLNIKLKELDRADVGVFKVVTENKLWENRAKAYNYIV